MEAKQQHKYTLVWFTVWIHTEVNARARCLNSKHWRKACISLFWWSSPRTLTLTLYIMRSFILSPSSALIRILQMKDPSHTPHPDNTLCVSHTHTHTHTHSERHPHHTHTHTSRHAGRGGDRGRQHSWKWRLPYPASPTSPVPHSCVWTAWFHCTVPVRSRHSGSAAGDCDTLILQSRRTNQSQTKWAAERIGLWQKNENVQSFLKAVTLSRKCSWNIGVTSVEGLSGFARETSGLARTKTLSRRSAIHRDRKSVV